MSPFVSGLAAEPFVLTVTQIVLALGGFAGVVLAMRPREIPLSAQKQSGMLLILESAFGPAFFALVPMPIHHFSGREFGKFSVFRFAHVGSDREEYHPHTALAAGRHARTR